MQVARDLPRVPSAHATLKPLTGNSGHAKPASTAHSQFGGARRLHRLVDRPGEDLCASSAWASPIARMRRRWWG